MLPHAFKEQEAESYGAGVKVDPLHTQQLEADEMEIKVKIKAIKTIQMIFVSCLGFLFTVHSFLITF